MLCSRVLAAPRSAVATPVLHPECCLLENLASADIAARARPSQDVRWASSFHRLKSVPNSATRDALFPNLTGIPNAYYEPNSFNGPGSGFHSSGAPRCAYLVMGRVYDHGMFLKVSSDRKIEDAGTPNGTCRVQRLQFTSVFAAAADRSPGIRRSFPLGI